MSADRNFAHHIAHFDNVASLAEIQLISLVHSVNLYPLDRSSRHVVDRQSLTISIGNTQSRLTVTVGYDAKRNAALLAVIVSLYYLNSRIGMGYHRHANKP